MGRFKFAAAVVVIDYVIRSGRRSTARTGLGGNLRRRRLGRPIRVKLTVTDGGAAAIDGRRFLPPGGQLVVDTFFQS